MKIVSPFRPFEAESVEHKSLGAFDWIAALRMLRESARRATGHQVIALTDVDTDLGVPSYQYVTTQRRLMLWILEVSLRYLESDDFNQNTVLMSPDMLVFGDLSRWLTADFAVLARSPKHVAAGRPTLNSVQWWSLSAKKPLIKFYRRALAIAETLSEDSITWGADTEPLVRLLSPVERGEAERAGMRVLFVNEEDAVHSVLSDEIAGLESGLAIARPSRPVVDFRYRRKLAMAAYFRAMVDSEVPA